ncbi:uncharacterized protein At3g17950-like isoform X1 [Malus sylvestris]|uniref:uncharacterized protein At3g17950-like isoform X1 n=1 Tax=Malus sylvestris TaxID=3752 RepID=UPI0021ABDD61|nr:uncharacterized protein At3g17950-like isoform X1 [Malus sylvestris]
MEYTYIYVPSLHNCLDYAGQDWCCVLGNYSATTHKLKKLRCIMGIYPLVFTTVIAYSGCERFWTRNLESTGSFFHDRSITLGSLIGINNILELSRRSLRGRKTDHQAAKDRKTNNNDSNNTKFRLCFLSLCSKDSTDDENVRNHPPSLGHFLAAERQAANENYRTNPPIYGPDDELALAEHHQPARESNNSLFVDGQVAPPQSSPRFGSDHVDQRKSMLFSCMC